MALAAAGTHTRLMAGAPLVTDGFTSFTLEHFGLLGLLLVGAVLLGWVGRRWREGVGEERFRRAFAVAIPVFTVPMQVLQLLPDDFTMGTSLPLQLCDLAWMVAVYALWTRDHLAVSVLYFWGLTLTIQGAVTPSLGETFPDPRYFMFWGMHFLTIWAAVYLVSSAGGPTWRGYRFTLGCTAVWAVLVLGFNAITDTNYGYLSRKPESASLLDLLGPWPVYVAAEVAILAAVWALMTWPWAVRTHARGRARQNAAGDPEGSSRRRSVPPGSAGLAAASDAHQGTAGEERAEGGRQQDR